MQNTISMKIKFDHPLNAFALVVGGWFPLSLAPTGVILIDRNILSLLPYINTPINRHDSEANKWWLSYLNSEHFTLNPILCAFEGVTRSTPSFEQFLNSFNDACTTIKANLPKAKVVSFNSDEYVQAYKIITASHQRYQSETNFLINACPLIHQRKSNDELEKIEKELFSLCLKNGISPSSAIFFAVLSCLYELTNGDEPLIGRKIIKPSLDYDQKDAHNCLSDIRALEYLAASTNLNSTNLTFCTRDKHLAAFWCSLKFCAGDWSTGKVNINVQLNSQLFPRLTEPQIEELSQRINAYNNSNN